MGHIGHNETENGAARGCRTFHLTRPQLRRGYWFQGMLVLAALSPLAALLIGIPLLWYGFSTDMASERFACIALALVGGELVLGFLILWLWVRRKTDAPGTPPGGIITVSWDESFFSASYGDQQHTLAWKDVKMRDATGFSLVLLPDGACIWLFKEHLPRGALTAMSACAKKAGGRG